MKTVKPINGGVPERVKDADAEKRVQSGTHCYCKKEEWKKEVRDAAKRKAAEEAAKAKKEEKPKTEKRGKKPQAEGEKK
jgi:hypothetical protein